MNSNFPRRRGFNFRISLIIFFCLACNTMVASISMAYTGRLSSSTVYIDTDKITLNIYNLVGTDPPSSEWYDPQGNKMKKCPFMSQCITRIYHYAYGLLSDVDDYFYIAGQNRKTGLYSVKVGSVINLTFSILNHTSYIYLPLIIK